LAQLGIEDWYESAKSTELALKPSRGAASLNTLPVCVKIQSQGRFSFPSQEPPIDTEASWASFFLTHHHTFSLRVSPTFSFVQSCLSFLIFFPSPINCRNGIWGDGQGVY